MGGVICLERFVTPTRKSVHPFASSVILVDIIYPRLVMLGGCSHTQLVFFHTH